jgi:hypothetical protein
MLGLPLPPTIRAPTIDELSSLSDLCFRSKAVWGYDEEFMEACRGELSFEPRDLALTFIAVAEHNGKPIGVAQVKVVDREADLLKLFVESTRFAVASVRRCSFGLLTSRKNWVPRN